MKKRVDEGLIIRMFHDGVLLRVIADAAGVSATTVRAVLVGAGLSGTRRPHLDDAARAERDARIAELRRAGASGPEIAEGMGVSVETVKAALRRLGLVKHCRKAGGFLAPADGDAKDRALLREGELQDIVEWMADIRAGRRPWEARIPENYLRRMDRLVAMVRGGAA